MNKADPSLCPNGSVLFMFRTVLREEINMRTKMFTKKDSRRLMLIGAIVVFAIMFLFFYKLFLKI